MTTAEGAAPNWTPTQARLIAALADGQPHTRAELVALIDSEADLGNLNYHLCQIRRTLRPRGEDVLCVLHRRTLMYRHVRLKAAAGRDGAT